MKNIPLLVIVLISFASAYAQSTTKCNADKSRSFITYGMVHPMHEWEGTCKEVNSVMLYDPAEKKIVKAALVVPVAGFDSQNANRDSHTIEVVEGIKFPNVTFSSTAISEGTDSLTVSGNLVFHGVSKPVTFKVKETRSEDEIGIAGAFSILMTDYKIEIPSMMGMPARNDISLKFSVIYKLK